MKQSFKLSLRNQWPNILFAFRGTSAAICALVGAELLQLQCPYWAALTALIVIQPTRGLLYEKSIYRLVGTAIGALGGLLLSLNIHSQLALCLALALWIMLCAFIGTLLYGQRSYACMMAGLTCAVITMSGSLNPTQLHNIAFSRVAAIVIGIAVATAFTAFFTPKQSLNDIFQRLTQLSATTIRWLSLQFLNDQAGRKNGQDLDILLEIAEIESLLDVALAGTLHSRQEIQQTTHLISALLSLLGTGGLLSRLTQSAFNQNAPQRLMQQLAKQLEKIADQQAEQRSIRCLSELQETLARLKKLFPQSQLSLDELGTALQQVLLNTQILRQTHQENSPSPLFLRQRDWREALRCGLRAGISIMLGGVVWSLTGWHQGPLLIMALAIMLTIFATQIHPAALLQQVLTGAVIGALTAIFYKLVLLAGNTGATAEYLAITPFLLLALFSKTQQRFAIIATDATYIFILVLQPGVFTEVKSQDMLFGAFAMLLGIGCAWLAYRYLFPVNPFTRMQALLDSTLKDIRQLALERNPLTIHRLEAVIRHKIVRSIILARHYDTDYLAFIDGGLVVLSIVASFQQLRQLFNRAEAPGDARTILRSTLAEIGNSRTGTQQLQQIMERASRSARMMAEAQQRQACAATDLEFALSLQTSATLLSESLRTWEQHSGQLRELKFKS